MKRFFPEMFVRRKGLSTFSNKFSSLSREIVFLNELEPFSFFFLICPKNQIFYYLCKWEGVGTSTIRTSTGQKFQNVEMVFLVDQNVEIRTSKMSFELIRTSKSELSQRRKANYHNVEKSWSILRNSQRRKEWKERRKSHFCLIFTF